LAGLVFFAGLATALCQSPLAIAKMEMPAKFAAIDVQKPALDLDRAALGAKPLHLVLRLAVRAKTRLPALTAAVVLWGIQNKEKH
jgi:hypothetical protein